MYIHIHVSIHIHTYIHTDAHIHRHLDIQRPTRSTGTTRGCYVYYV